MNKNRMSGAAPTFLAVIVLSCVMLGDMASFGGSALAATSPTVKKLTFIDTKGTPATDDDSVVTMSTGYKPFRAAVDSKGNVYVTDPELNTVYKFNSNGHLANTFNTIHMPLAIATSNSGDIFVSGVRNGSYATFVIDQAGAFKGILGVGLPTDIELDSRGDVLTIDRGGSLVKVLNKDGVLQNTFGPFVERFDGPETIGSYERVRTRHRLLSTTAIVSDIAAGEVYVTFREWVDYLSNSSTGCDGSTGNCSVDPDSYIYYANTDASYKYWYPAGARYLVAVMDMNSGAIKRKIYLDTYITNDTNPADPYGICLDNSGRLYVSTILGVQVYDALTGTPLTINGGFASAIYEDFAFDAVNSRLIATTTTKMVDVYSIDGGVNPANTPPSPPVPVSPSDGSYAYSRTPVLKIANATDSEADPLTYGYEIKDSSGAIITSGSGISGGANGETLMPVVFALAENSPYRWRSQSFDGNASSWSEERAFCVNEINDNPQAPAVISPTETTPASPFSSLLTWSSSTDPDCYDKVTYNVEVSSDRSFGSVLSSPATGTSLMLGDLASDLKNGGTYYWRVKAVDNNGGESAYSEGSFVYKSTMVSFTSDQADTQVYIDGNYGYLGRPLGKAPIEVQNITPGSHFVAFVKAGYEPYYTTINVLDDGGILPVFATMIAASKIRPTTAGIELGRVGIGASSPFVVDYNNDSLKDIMAGGKDGRVYLYLSERQIVEGKEKVVLVASGVLQADNNDINVGSMAVPFVVDYNNDGRKDLLVGSSDGNVYIYMNKGSESAPIFTSAGTIRDVTGNDIRVASNSAPVIIDYNHDGRKDLAAGSGDGTLRVYINTGSDSSPVFDSSYMTVISADGTSINVGSNSKPFFTDWDSDGKTDLLIGSGSALRLYLNNGGDGSPQFSYNQDLRDLTGGAGDVAPFVVDWGGSSSRDIVVGNGAGAIVSYMSAMCGGFGPDNIPPTAPTILSPLNGIYVTSANPVLTVANASDAEGCSITYGYEVRDGNGQLVTSASGAPEGQNGTTVMTLNQVLLENMTYYWRAMAFDGDAGTGTTWSSPDSTFTVDATPPTGSISVNNGTNYTNSVNVVLNIACRDSGSGCRSMQLSNDGENWSIVEPYVDSRSWTLSAGEGSKTIYVKVLDNAGNGSGVYSATVTVDTVVPVFSATTPATNSFVNTVIIGYTLNKAVMSGKVTFKWESGAADADGSHVYNFTSSDLTAGTHSVNTGFALKSGAVYTVTFEAVDPAGNNAATVTSANVVYDTTSAVVTIDYPASGSRVNTSMVNYTMSSEAATGGIVITRTDGAAEDLSPYSYIMNEGDLTAGEHKIDTGMALVNGAVYTISIKNVIDRAGNESAPVANTLVTYDSTAVSITNTMPSANAYISLATVGYALSEQAQSGRVVFTWTGGASDAGSPRVYNLAGVELYAGAHEVNTELSLVEGAIYTISFEAVDMAGNPSTTISNGNIFFAKDVTPPSGSISINGGGRTNNVTYSVNVTLNLACSDAGTGCASMQFSNDGGNWSAPEAYATTKTWTLSSGYGLKKVYVKFIDKAGNRSSAYSQTITLGNTGTDGLKK